MADAKDEDQVTDADGTLTPEEIEHRKLFEEYAARHRGGAAPAAAVSADDKADDDEIDDDADDEADTATDKAAATAAADAAAKGDDGDKAAAQTDIWVNATPEQKAAYEAATATNKALEQYKRSNEGRINSFQRQIDQLNTALAGRATADTKAAATAAEKKVDDASKQLNDLLNDPDFVAAEKEYPEVYKPMRKVIGGALAMVGNVQAKASALEAELGTFRKTTATRFEAEDIQSEGQKLVELEPDYIETVSRADFKPAFDGWLQGQPTKVQELVRDAATDGVKNAADTSWAFRKFKADTGFGAPARAPAKGDTKAKTSTSSATDQTRRALQLEGNTSHRSPRVSARPTDKDGTDGNADALWRSNVERIKKRQREEGLTY